MSAIEHLLPWTQQPQEAVGIDWGNPLARGLLLAVAGNGASGGQQYATPFGIGVRGATAPAPAVRHGVANSTILVVHALPLPDGGNFWSANESVYGDTSAGWPGDLGLFMRSPASYGRIVVGARNTSGVVVDTGVDIDAYPGNLPLGGRFVAAATIESDLLVRGFGDGVYAGSSTKLQGYSYNPPASGAAAPRVGVPAGVVSDTVTAQLLVLRWGRVLGDDEIAQISANPWQLFEPRRIWVPVAAGGGGTTVALSGISATFAQTAPAVSSATPLVGESVTANAGILLPAFSRSLSGQAGTAFAGTLNTSTSRGLSGQSAAFAAGSVIPSVAIAAIGLQATFASGTLTASSSSGTTVNLVGEPVAFAQTAPSVNVTIALTGIAAIMASGLLSASNGTAIITVKAGSWLRYKKLQ